MKSQFLAICVKFRMPWDDVTKRPRATCKLLKGNAIITRGITIHNRRKNCSNWWNLKRQENRHFWNWRGQFEGLHHVHALFLTSTSWNGLYVKMNKYQIDTIAMKLSRVLFRWPKWAALRTEKLCNFKNFECKTILRRSVFCWAIVKRDDSFPPGPLLVIHSSFMPRANFQIGLFFPCVTSFLIYIRKVKNADDSSQWTINFSIHV